MTDQLALGDVPLVDAPVKFTLEQHQRTKRFFAVMWQLGEPVGLAGHFDKPPAQADLPGQQYSRNVSVIKRLAEDFLRRDTYSRWEYDA